MEITSTKIETSIEKRIVTGLIVSKNFLYEIYPSIDLGYFKNKYLQTIAKWAVEFYEIHKSAPFIHIQDIYNNERERLKDDQATLIKEVLVDISDRYEASDHINVDYLAKQARKYFKRREVELTIGNARYYLEKGDIDNAEKVLGEYRKIIPKLSEWINPFSQHTVDSFFNEYGHDFFRFPGHLGSFLKNFERGWLVGISGRFKLGKTWFAQEFGLIGILSRLRVAFFSLEMTKRKMLERIYKRITGTTGHGGLILYPVFDCAHNQSGVCDSPRRASDVDLIVEGDEVANYEDNPNYIPCTWCRDAADRLEGTNNEKKIKARKRFRKEYEAATWWQPMNKPQFDHITVGEKVDAMQRNYGHLFRVKIYPRFSANISDIMSDLDALEIEEGFSPDIVIIDYADILKPEDGVEESGINKEDRTWIALSQLAGEKNCLTIAPTQVTKDALDAFQLKQKHTSRWIGKLGHVDAMITLNQTGKEKERGVMRVGVMVHRHEDFSEKQYVTILQSVESGQVHLDS